MIKDETIRRELNSELTEINMLIFSLESNAGGNEKATDAFDRLLEAHKIKIDLLKSLDTI